MERALIASDAPKATDFYRSFLEEHGIKQIVTAQSPAKARQLAAAEEFDVCLVNIPFLKGNGIELAKDLADKSNSQIILFVKAEIFEAVAEDVLHYGIITVQKPINKLLFGHALHFAYIANERMRHAAAVITKLEKRLKEQNTIARAKCVLIEKESYTEEEAHKYIERHAMNAQVSRLEIAQEIIEYYD